MVAESQGKSESLIRSLCAFYTVHNCMGFSPAECNCFVCGALPHCTVDPEPHLSEPSIIRPTIIMIFVAFWCASNRTYFYSIETYRIFSYPNGLVTKGVRIIEGSTLCTP